MHTKKINTASNFLIGIGFIIFAIIILNTSVLTLSTISWLFGIAFIVAGIGNIISYILESLFTNDKKTTIKMALINLGTGIIILLTPNMQISVFGIICGIYAIVIGVVRGINYILYRNNHVNGRFINLILCIFFIAYGGLLMFSPLLRIGTVLNIIAVYFILYGLTYLRDGIREIIPNRHKNTIKRKIRISLPVFLVALVPRAVLSEVNSYLEPKEEGRVNAKPDFKETKLDVVPDVEVFVHVTEEGYGAIGHVDLRIDDTVITYGNYDASSYKLFDSIGDGVLIQANSEQYIPFVIKDSKKTLFGFGLNLNELQIKGVHQKLAEIKSNVYEWHPPAYTNDPEKDFYATRLRHDVEAKFFKFNSGKFKTYFVAGTNCVLLADQIIGAAGLDLIGINGIITPGTYYEYLNNEFASSNDLVISKNIYQ